MPKQDVTVELFYDSAWHDLVAADDVYAEPITIMRGNSDESAAPRPATVELQLANDDDLYRTTNPESPLYGKAGVNTPLRVSMAGTVRAHVEASSFAAGQSMSFQRHPKHGKAWVDVEAGGILQRVNQWTEPLKSAFREYNDSLSHVIGYWPAEQPRGSTRLISTVPGTSSSPLGTTSLGGAGPFVGMTFESQHQPLGSGPLMDFDSDNAEVGPSFAKDPGASTTSGWQLSWVARYEPLAAGDQSVMTWATTDGSQWTLTLNQTTGNINIFASDSSGATLINHTVSYSGWDWSQFTLISIDAQYSAGTTTIWVNWRNNTNTAGGFATNSYTGVPGRLDWWDASLFEGVSKGSTIGHIMGTDVSSAGGTDLFSTDRRAAFSGWLTESAADRFAFLCILKGISYTILGTAADSHPMGPQGISTVAEQFTEIQTTEDGLIFDDIDAIGLVFMLRNHRYNQTPALTLNADGEDHGMPSLPVEVTDDLGIHNVVTAVQRDSDEYTATDSSSPMGNQPPPAGRGEYRQRRDVNVSDPQTGLYQQAYWWLYRGTVNLPRYPKLTINMAALDAAKLAEVEAVDVGSVIEITGYRENTIRLHVLGYTETIGRSDAERTITFTCAPDQQFQVGVWNDTDSRWDSKTCTLAEDLTTTETLWDVTAAEWADTFADPGSGSYPVTVGGEVCELTNATAPAGSGPFTQTLTCQRSRNGIVKTHQTGDRITVATPGRWAL